MKKKLAFLAALSIAAGTFADEQEVPEVKKREPAQVTVLVDKDMSPYAGGETLLSLEKSLIDLADYNMDEKYFTDKSLAGRLKRALELWVGWNSINCATMIAQHEVYGHGYRIRNTPGMSVAGYSVDFAEIPPFINGAATGFNISDYTTLKEMNVVTLDGVKATEILSQQLKMKWLESGKIDGRQASLYEWTSMDATHYTSISTDTKLNDIFADHGDINVYVNYMNTLYPGANLSVKSLKKKMRANLLDPVLFYTWYAQYKYIMGEKEFEMPMIGGVYLPSMRCDLAPYGPEWVFQNYFKTKEHGPIYAYTKWGSLAGLDHWGAGIEAPKLMQWENVSLGACVDYFDQFESNSTLTDREFSKNYRNLVVKDEGVSRVKGGSALLMGALRVPGLHNVELLAQLGFKSRGYLPGYPMDEGVIARAGASAKF